MAANRQVLARARRAGGPTRSPVAVRAGGKKVSDVQRARMLSSAVAVVSEQGFERLTVARVTERARVSRRTFYDIFEDREDCFLAAFDEAVAELAGKVVPAFEREGRWREKIRAGLAALLEALDAHPNVCSLVVVDALAAGRSVAERRQRVLDTLSGVVDQGRGEDASAVARELPGLTGEGIVGAVAGVIHARVLERDPAPLLDVLNPLMAMIVLPYQGHAAARREHERPVPAPSPATRVSRTAAVKDPLEGLAMRMTYRTLKVLEAVAERGGQGSGSGSEDPSNREIADAAGIADQGQISRLLARLKRLGLLENTGSEELGAPNAWRLTPRGEGVERAMRVRLVSGGKQCESESGNDL
jgi:AcrR family transcriptional regulator